MPGEPYGIHVKADTHILDRLVSPAYLRDERGRCRACNAAFAKLLDAETSELIGRRVVDFAPKLLPPHEGIQAAEQTFRTRLDDEGGELLVHESPCRGDNEAEAHWTLALVRATAETPAGSAMAAPATAQRIMDVNPFPLVLFDLEGRPVRYNRALIEILGAPAPPGWTIFDDPLAKQTGVADRLKEIRRGRIVHMDPVWFNPREISPELPDRPRCLAGVFFPVPDNDGRLTHFIAVYEDLTDQRIAEDRLRATNRQLRSIIDNSWDLIVEVDAEGRHVLANRAVERVTGYTSEELRAISMFDLLAPEYHELVRERIRRRKAGRSLTQPFVCEIIRKDDRRATIEMTTTAVVRDGRFVGVQGIARDITERQQADAALRASEQRFRTLTANIPGAVYRCRFDDAFSMVYLSGAIEDISGYPARTFLNGERTYAAIIHPDDRQDVRRAVSRALSREEPFAADYRIVHRDGSVRYVSERGREARDEEADGDGPPLLDGVIIDVTERRHADERLREARAELIAAREQERRRLALELHDSVGQQLFAMDLILRGLVDGPEAGKLPDAEMLHRLADRCSDLIREVRCISYGLYPPTLESLGLAMSLDRLGATLGGPVDLEVRYPKTMRRLRLPDAVEIALFRVAQEAVRNAVRHANAGRVVIRLQQREGDVVLTVTDDGQGFAADRDEPGIGLNSMRERVETVGGRLSISSRKGRTRVTARAPKTVSPGGIWHME